MQIPLNTTEPLIQRKRSGYSAAEMAFMEKQTALLVNLGVVAELPANHTTNYLCNNSVPAKKDADGNWTDMRMCGDFRMLNACTAPDHYGLHHTTDLHQRIGTARFFTKIDARQGYMQLHLDENDWLKTCYRVGNKIYYYKRVPFGLRNAPSYFQRVLDSEIKKEGMTDSVCCYIDDILIVTDTLD